jgi:hypothetical protein
MASSPGPYTQEERRLCGRKARLDLNLPVSLKGYNSVVNMEDLY